MGAPSRETTINQLVEALSSVKGFPLTEEELKEWITKTDVFSKTKQTKNRATSAHEIWKGDNKGTKPTQSWTDFKKENPEAIEELQLRADKINEDRNLPSKAEAKAQKVKKNAEEKELLKQELLKIKNATKEISSKTESSPESSPKSSSPEPDFDKIDQNGDGVISREEYEKFIETTETHTSDTEDKEEQEEQENEDEIIENIPEKPKFTGKNPDTALNNFKQWKLNKLGKPPNQSIPREELKDYQEEDGFDKNIYDESCDWFEYIKNNMS